MMRFVAAVLAAAALETSAALAGTPSAYATYRGAVTPVRLTLDGRPVDRTDRRRYEGSALARDGVVYGNLIDLVRAFDGLVTIKGDTVTVSVSGKTASFTGGSKTAIVGDGSALMPGQAFFRSGELYVPLQFFVTRVTAAKVRIDPTLTRAAIFVNANPLS